MSKAKGSVYERELVNAFDAAGWGALRLPSSGSAIDRDLPDVLAGRPVPVPGRGKFTETLAIEAKSGKATTLYVDAVEVDALEAFARRWGATPYLSARFTTQGSATDHYLVAPEDARRTDGGAYGLPRVDAAERASVVVGSGGVEER